MIEEYFQHALEWARGVHLSTYYYIGEWLLRIIMLFVVPYRRGPVSAQVWLLFIFIFPLPGLIFYLILGRAKLTIERINKQRYLNELLKEVVDRYKIDSDHAELYRTPTLDTWAPVIQLVECLGGLPVVSGNQFKLITNYENVFEHILRDIENARFEIHILYYIFANDETGKRFVDALVRAKERGVTVRVLMDAVGSGAYIDDHLDVFERNKIEAYAVLPVSPFHKRSARFDLRNHRKIIVIDGLVGYTGSQNIINAEYSQEVIYEELVIRAMGLIVKQLQATFFIDWYSETDELLNPERPGDDMVKVWQPTEGLFPAQILPSGPAYDTENTLLVFNTLLYLAKKRIVMTTPYFIPDESLMKAIESAARRGVEVHVVVSSVSDQRMVHWAQLSFYEELLFCGVKIHQMDAPVLLHAKHISVDDGIAVIGSSNLDIRSFRLNLEVLLLVYDPVTNAELRKIEETYFARSRTLTLDEWEKRPVWKKWQENTFRLMAPLL